MGDVAQGRVDLLPSFVGDDHLERVLEASSTVGLAEGPAVFVVVRGQDVVDAHVARLHAAAERVTVVPFGQHEFTQVYGHAAQRVVNHCNHVLDLRFGERRLPLTVAYLTYLAFARLDLPVEQRHALAGVGGKLHARMLDLHDDRVRLRARQRAGVILKPRQRLDRTMGAGGETVQEPVRCGVMRVGEPCVIVIALTGQVGEDAPGGVRDGLILPELVFAGVDEPGQALREAFLQGLTGQLAGQRVEGRAEQRHVHHRILTEQQSQHAGFIDRPQPFHLPSDITHERPLFPLVLARRASRSPDKPR